MLYYSIALIILGLFALIFIAEFYKIVFRGYAPFLSTRKKVIDKILEYVEIKSSEDDVFELGCGKASFLRAVEKKFPKAEKIIGVESAFWPYFMAGIQVMIERSKIKLKKKDLFKVDLSRAEVIYCFLNMKMMDELKVKFENECQPGTQIISYRFKINGWEADKVIDVDGEKGKDKVYFYKVK